MSPNFSTTGALIAALWIFLASVCLGIFGASIMMSFGRGKRRLTKAYIRLFSKHLRIRLSPSNYRFTGMAALLAAGIGFYSAIRLITEFGF